MCTCIWGGNSTRTAAFLTHFTLGRGSPLTVSPIYRVSVHARPSRLARDASYFVFDFKLAVPLNTGFRLSPLETNIERVSYVLSSRVSSPDLTPRLQLAHTGFGDGGTHVSYTALASCVGVVHAWVGQILLKCNDFKR